MLCSFLLLALLATVQGRAVNISNTWVLPEEGFPVFYRYFRDRISWYEADAVCQFHHANLVTVDTTAQYDAVRAYLKELDISSAVWVGLIRSNPDGDFTWTDYRGLSGDGYWSSAPDARSAPLCAAADPAADYRWEARACGGPTVASFICELPVPQWALGNEGCMVRALPALTVLYLPESAAVQLTADCGLAGVKRVQCTGNVKHEELLKDLSCFEEDESSSPPSITSTTTNWVITEVDQETFNDSITEENVSTEHENDFSGLNSISSTPDLFKHIAVTQNKLVTRTEPVQYQDNKIALNKNINLDVIQHNNLQSNDIPKLPDHDNFYSNEEMEKQEDNKHLQHKLLHDELARLGNFENIFSQPTDHFVPPLVMAKAKVNNDMNPVSFEEKLAQQHSEHDLIKHLDEQRHIAITESTTYDKSTTEASSTHTSSTSTSNPVKVYDKKEMNKHISPKKYTIKSTDLKNKFTKYIETKQSKIDKTTSLPLTTEITTKEIETTTLKRDIQFDLANEDNTLDLTVLIKEPELNDEAFKMRPNISYNFEGLEMNDTSPNKVENNYTNDDITTRGYEFNNAVTLNDEIIKITLIHDDNDSSTNKTVFEITTKIPIFKDDSEYNITTTASSGTTTDKPHDSTTPLSTPASTTLKEENGSNFNVDTNENTNKTYTMSSNKFFDNKGHEVEKVSTERSFTELTPKQEEDLIEHTNNKDFSTSSTVTSHPAAKEINHDFEETDHVDDFERNATETFQEIDDYQSPLLSGANEPPHKPNRSRRPQQPPNRIKKFNPFRILG